MVCIRKLWWQWRAFGQQYFSRYHGVSHKMEDWCRCHNAELNIPQFGVRCWTRQRFESTNCTCLAPWVVGTCASCISFGILERTIRFAGISRQWKVANRGWSMHFGQSLPQYTGYGIFYNHQWCPFLYSRMVQTIRFSLLHGHSWGYSSTPLLERLIGN